MAGISPHQCLFTLTVTLLCGATTFAQERFTSLASIGRIIDHNGQITARNIVNDTGWTHLRAFRWTIELYDPQTDRFATCSPRRKFRDGEKFRLRITSAVDAYCYVLVKNADCSEELLLPSGARVSPKLTAGKEIILPENDSFLFTPPAKREELWLVMAPTPLPFIAPQEIWTHLRKLQNGEKLSETEQAALANLKGIRTKGLDDAIKKTNQLRVPQDLDAVLHSFREGARKRGVELVATAPQGDDQLVVHGAARPDPSQPVIEIISLEHSP